VLIPILLFAVHFAAPHAVADSTCIDARVDSRTLDSVDLGGHRYDQPEHIRELRVPRAKGQPYVWLLDTSLDGLERYDTIAISETPDPEGSLEDFIPLKKIQWYPGDPPQQVRLCW
jgi:hypothetical protein